MICNYPNKIATNGFFVIFVTNLYLILIFSLIFDGTCLKMSTTWIQLNEIRCLQWHFVSFEFKQKIFQLNLKLIWEKIRLKHLNRQNHVRHAPAHQPNFKFLFKMLTVACDFIANDWKYFVFFQCGEADSRIFEWHKFVISLKLFTFLVLFHGKIYFNPLWFGLIQNIRFFNGIIKLFRMLEISWLCARVTTFVRVLKIEMQKKTIFEVCWCYCRNCT